MGRFTSSGHSARGADFDDRRSLARRSYADDLGFRRCAATSFLGHGFPLPEVGRAEYHGPLLSRHYEYGDRKSRRTIAAGGVST